MARVMKTPGPPARKAKQPSPKGVHDKKLIVALVIAQLKPNWGSIASALDDKTDTKVHDVWRKSIHPALVAGKPWSDAGSTWTTEEKIKLVTLVMESGKVDWNVIANTIPGHTKPQLYDVWRKAILPKLKRGEPVQ